MKRTFSINANQPISRYFYHTGAVASLVKNKRAGGNDMQRTKINDVYTRPKIYHTVF